MKIAVIQNNAKASTAASLQDLATMFDELVGEDVKAVFLPEYCTCYSLHEGRLIIDAQPEEAHMGLAFFSQQALRLNCQIMIGSLAIQTPHNDLPQHAQRIVNRSYLIAQDGSVKARYDKIHLFDVCLSADEIYRESDTLSAGREAVVVNSAVGRLGMSICYDLRFANLYRQLAQFGAEILAVPAAFTQTTGEAHWHVLNRSRAIETGSYVVAACQCGEHGDARSYGHSLVINPWGEIVAEAGEGAAVIVANIELSAVAEARKRIPSLDHDREFVLVNL